MVFRVFRPVRLGPNFHCCRKAITFVIFFFLIGCNDRPLGMENNDIPNSAITASSTWPPNAHEPWRARLHNVKTSLSTGSWSAASNNVGEWLQIDLGKETVVTKIAHRGGLMTTFTSSGSRHTKFFTALIR